jgi:hypothetical protein
MMDWRTIESAPREGWLLLHSAKWSFPAAEVQIGKWNPARELWGDPGGFHFNAMHGPTHWQPLPVPPRAA